MYEGFFGLEKRPFSAVPNPESFIALDPTQEVLDDLLICLVQSRGIAVVTSGAGLGKTILCKQIAESTEKRFQTVYLSTSAFTTRRALLQAILYEFGIQYEGLSEQEARLKILEAARAIASENRLLLIIVDEAHLLNSRLFEELRTLSDYAPEGEGVIRLILSGQFELEEKLADPSMSAIHQRIGCQVALDPLSLEDSAKLVRNRLKIAGAEDVDKVLASSALEAICRASDGNARCLCQLADHSFLLAFAEEQKPVQRETVLAALDDLKELPLHWNELPGESSDIRSSSIEDESLDEVEEAQRETNEFEIPIIQNAEIERSFVLHLPEEKQVDGPLAETFRAQEATEEFNEVEYSVFEVGAELPTSGQDESQSELSESHDQEPQLKPEQNPEAEPFNDFIEEVIVDKYASLDRSNELPIESMNDESESISVADSVEGSEDFCDQEEGDQEENVQEADIDGAELLQTIESLREEISFAVDESKSRLNALPEEQEFEREQRLDVVQPEEPMSSESSSENCENSESDVAHVNPERCDQKDQADGPDCDEAQRDGDSENLRFAQLFTRLSQRRRRLKQRRAS